MKQYQFSVIIPAHNEENHIYKCLKSVRTAAKQVGSEKVEIIVVANRCTDKTAETARYYGEKVIVNDSKCISSIRNTGIRVAQGNIIVTIDADSMMTKYSLVEIRQMLQSGNYIGGGTQPRFDQMSFGIFCSSMYVALNLLPVMMKNKAFLSRGMFWFYRKDLETIGGFDEALSVLKIWILRSDCIGSASPEIRNTER